MLVQTLWEYNGVYQDGSGAYTGANALEQWRTEFGQTNATYIPIELGGGSGTSDGHGRNYRVLISGITDGNGNDMRNELMGGWLNQPTFVSNMTIMSFADISYDLPQFLFSKFYLLHLVLLGFLVLKDSRTRFKNEYEIFKYYLFLIYFLDILSAAFYQDTNGVLVEFKILMVMHTLFYPDLLPNVVLPSIDLTEAVYLTLIFKVLI